MADIITTLHPENDENTNLYPNIKKENIPNEAVDRTKLSDEVNNLLNSINELHPSGTDISTTILAFTTNKGVYVATDNNKWYYWNGTQYVEGGVFISSTTYTILPTNTDLNTITSQSNYLLVEANTYINMPYNVKSGLLITIALPTGLKEQILIGFGTPDVYFRSYVISWRRWNSRFYTRSLPNNTDLDTLSSDGIIYILNSLNTFNNNPFPNQASYIITLDAIGTTQLSSCLTQICIKFDGSIAIRSDINNMGYGNWKYNLTDTNVNHWYGKTWYAYGTSITNIANEGKYPIYLAQLSGMTLVNKGISGGGIGNLGAYSQGQVYNAICNITDGKLNADLITLECGANDVDANVPLGTIYDTGQSTLCGCFNDCIRYLQANTNAQIVVIPSIPSKTLPNELNQYYKFQMMMKQMCFINRIEFIEGNDSLGYGRIFGNTTYTSDNIHQTNLGGYNLAKSIWEKLKNVPLFYTAIPN